MKRILYGSFALTAIAALTVAPGVDAQMEIAEPFKVGTFEIDGGPEVGIVLRDQLVVQLDEANAALQMNPAYPAIPMPVDMLDLIARYEYGMKARLYEIVNHMAASGMIRPDGASYVPRRRRRSHHGSRFSIRVRC